MKCACGPKQKFLNGNGGGMTAATSIAQMPYCSSAFSTLARFSALNLRNAASPPLRAIKYKINEPIVEPAIAAKTYSGISAGVAIESVMTTTSGPPGMGMKAASQSAIKKIPSAPKPTQRGF